MLFGVVPYNSGIFLNFFEYSQQSFRACFCWCLRIKNILSSTRHEISAMKAKPFNNMVVPCAYSYYKPLLCDSVQMWACFQKKNLEFGVKGKSFSLSHWVGWVDK